jgi:thiol-disulfide isomerase/thioredoxin
MRRTRRIPATGNPNGMTGEKEEKSTMGKYTIRVALVLFGLAAWLIVAGVSSAAGPTTSIHQHTAEAAPSGRVDVPLFELPMPDSESGRSYLGVSGTGNFNIGQIKTRVLLIEVYSIYCPNCQRAAAHVNELYQLIQQNPDLKDKIKLIGIGVTNTAYEVNLYREKYRVPFPLFPDQNLDIAKNLHVSGTPTFIGIELNGAGGATRFHFSEGGFDDIQKFLDEIVKSSGLN